MTKLTYLLTSFSIVLCMFFVLSCENDYPPSLYDPNEKGNPTPVISSVDPADVALSGVTVVTIKGENFVPDDGPLMDKNMVFFNGAKGTVLSATANILTVRAPIFVADSVLIRVAAWGAELFGRYEHKYALEAAQMPLVNPANPDEPYGITVDALGNVYASWVTSAAGQGIRKITVDGAMSTWAPKGGETKYSALKMGPNNVLYAARIQKAIFQITENQKGAVFVSAGMGTIYDLDFDANKNIWGVGNNDKIYRVKMDKALKTFDFKANLRAVRVFENYLYVAGAKDNKEKIWRFPLSADGELGAVEEYFDFTSATNNSVYLIYAITLAKDGDLYIGSDAPEAIFVVHGDKTMEALYPGQFLPKVLAFSWGVDTKGVYQRLYLSREKKLGADGISVEIQGAVIWVNMQKEGAPYYGVL